MRRAGIVLALLPVAIFAGGGATLPRSMTPQLESDLSRILEEEIEALDGFAAEAASCGAAG